MRRSLRSGLLLAAALAATVATSVQAGPVTGNPLADDWAFNGNSLDNGTYVYVNSSTLVDQGGVTDWEDIDKVYDFDVYSTSFHLDAGSALLGNGWGIGDVIIGIGAVVNQTPNLNSAVRVLTKYGASDADFRPSTVAPNDTNPPSIPNVNPAPYPGTNNTSLWGDGIGNSGASGTGGVIMDTPQIWGGIGRSPWFDADGAGNVILIDGSRRPDPNNENDGVASTRRYVGGSSVGSLDQYGVIKFIYQLDEDTELLSSFESYLNVSLLERNGFTDNPAPGDGFVIAIQNVSAEFTKTTGVSPDLGVIPEPSSLVLASLGLGGLVFAVRRRGRASA